MMWSITLNLGYIYLKQIPNFPFHNISASVFEPSMTQSFFCYDSISGKLLCF